MSRSAPSSQKSPTRSVPTKGTAPSAHQQKEVEEVARAAKKQKDKDRYREVVPYQVYQSEGDAYFKAEDYQRAIMCYSKVN